MSSSAARNNSQRSGAAADLRAIPLAVYRLYEMLGLYPIGHAAITTAAADGAAAIEAALRVKSPVNIAIVGDTLQMESTTAPVDAMLRPLVKLLDDCDLVALDIIASLTPEQFTNFVQALRDGHRDHVHGAQLAEQLQKSTNGRAWFRPMNFSKLSARAANPANARRTSGDSESDDRRSWNERLRSLVLDNTLDGDEAEYALSDVADFDRSDCDGEPLHMEHIAEILRETPAAQQPVVAQRLRTLIDSLGDKFRASLFNINALDDVRATRDMADAASALPPDELLHALEVSARQGARPTNATVMLFNKLLNLFEGDPTRVQRLSSIYGNLPQTPATDNVDVEGTLNELLSTRSDKNYNPNDYSSTLQRIVRPGVVVSSFGSSSQSWDDPAIHAAQIAAAILKTETGRTDEGPWQFIARSIDAIIQQGRLDILEQTIEASHLHGKTVDEPVRKVIEEINGALIAPQRVERIITLLDDRALQSPAARRVLAQTGPHGLANLIRSYDTLPVESRGACIECLCQDFAELFRKSCDVLVGQHRELLKLAGNNAEFNEAVRIEFLTPLFSNPDALVRGDAFNVLEKTFARWPRQALLHGIQDTDTDIQRRSIVRLLQQSDDEAVRAVQELLAERDGRKANDFLFGVGVSVLAQLGEVGLVALTQAFESLASKPTKSHVRRALQILAALKPNREIPSVRQAIRTGRVVKLNALRIVFRIPKGATIHA